jgi:pyrroline-5-carboxylate reductase
MEIVIIGSGNTAAVLGRKFKAANHHILQIVSRNAPDASALAYEWNTVSTNYLSAINQNAEVYLIAVADDAIAEVAKDLKLPGKGCGAYCSLGANGYIKNYHKTLWCVLSFAKFAEGYEGFA